MLNSSNMKRLMASPITLVVVGCIMSACAQEKPSALSIDLGKDWYMQPMVRQNWTDILDTGGTQPKAGNIQGATFSFSRDGIANNDAWSAVGAGILSLSYSPVTTDLSGWHVLQAAFGPTVAINKVANSAATSNNVDHLYFAFAQGLQIVHGTKNSAYDHGAFTFGLEDRAGFVYETDTKLVGSLPGGVLELEPQLMYHSVSASTNSFMPWVALGWNNRLGSLTDGTALFLVQVRGWFHLEGGDIQRNGTSWNTVKGSFLRLGPECRVQITMPYLHNFSISAEYDYIPTVSGPKGKDYLYSIGGALPISLFGKSSSAKEPVSLTANYTKGGLILSKQVVDTFTVGLSITL